MRLTLLYEEFPVCYFNIEDYFDCYMYYTFHIKSDIANRIALISGLRHDENAGMTTVYIHNTKDFEKFVRLLKMWDDKIVDIEYNRDEVKEFFDGN